MSHSTLIKTTHSNDGQSALALESAAAALRSGNRAEAKLILRRRLGEASNDVAVLIKLAELAHEENVPAEAMMFLRRALAVQPDAPDLRLSLAQLLQQQREPHAALGEIQAIRAPARNAFEVRVCEAALLGELGEHEREIEVYRGLTHDVPNHPGLWLSLGNALKTIGRSSDAIEALRRSLAIRATYGEAYWALANLKSFRFDDRDMHAMRKALRGKITDIDAVHLHFALGKAFEDRGDSRLAFDHYARGNAIRAAAFPPSALTISGRVDATIAAFDAPLFDRFEGSGDPATDPIFVVGLQRSGSTLIEQILASHPLIEGTSELVAMEQLWERVGTMGDASGDPYRIIRKLDPSDLKKIGSEYLARARQFRRTDKPLFVDKLPANWLNVGFIRLILPNAKIIDARRHPMACGFSNFKQHYATGVAFAYSQESIGTFYRDYLRLMRHFDAVLPGHVHHILNEKLIEDPEAETRRLIEFVGVPFDEACLAPHRNERAVRTPSAEQVRRPINRDGVDYWRKFEPWLEPMKQALGPALDDWDRAG